MPPSMGACPTVSGYAQNRHETIRMRSNHYARFSTSAAQACARPCNPAPTSSMNEEKEDAISSFVVGCGCLEWRVAVVVGECGGRSYSLSGYFVLHLRAYETVEVVPCEFGFILASIGAIVM